MLAGFKLTALLNKLSRAPIQSTEPHAIQNNNKIDEMLQSSDPMKDYYISCEISASGKTLKLYAQNLTDLQRIHSLATLYQGLDADCDIAYYLHAQPTKQPSIAPRAKL